MKIVTLFLSVLLFISAAKAQRTAVVRGIGTQTCKAFVESTDKQFAQLVSQWILGNFTGYFRQAGDDPSRMLGDDLLVRTVIEICGKNAEKTIDDALTSALTALPASEVKRPTDH